MATSKLLAKIASDLQKPDGLTVVEPGREKEFLAPLPIGKLWGVGKTTLKELALLGVAAIGDLAGLPVEILDARFGKSGSYLHRAARGLDERPVVPEREAKSVGHEDTYEEDLVDRDRMRRELLSLATRVGARLRRYGLRGRTITLKVKFHDFKLVSRGTTLNEGTDDDLTIFRRAVRTPAADRGRQATGAFAGYQPEQPGPVRRTAPDRPFRCQPPKSPARATEPGR